MSDIYHPSLVPVGPAGVGGLRDVAEAPPPEAPARTPCPS